MSYPTLTQISSLCEIISKNENLNIHFDVDYDECWTKFNNITLPVYRYIMMLLIRKRYFELNRKMVQLKFKIK